MILITGASSGIGHELCLGLAKEGHKIFGIGRDIDKLSRLKAEIGESFEYEALDVRRFEDVEKVINKIEVTSEINILINCAAVYLRKEFNDSPIQTINEILDTNIKGVIYTCKAAIPHMIKRKKGRIINIGSVAGLCGIKNEAIYSASKHALKGFTDSISQELIPHGIGVTVIAPGGVETPLWNEKNPYPGVNGALVSSKEILDLVLFLMGRPAHVIYKEITLFPSIEWH